MNTKDKIESLLFVSSKALNIKKLADILHVEQSQIKESVDELIKEYDDKKGGIVIVRDGKKFQMMTCPENSQLIKDYLHQELTGELTRPSLETLTIIAYRQPITKNELEMIRGINCGLIIRNLQIRGLIEQKEDKKNNIIRYWLTFDFLKYLGVKDVCELPDYEKLNKDINLDELINQSREE